MPDQGVLFHETAADAIGTAIQALGGAKKVAGLLWPALKSETAYTRLRHCLSDEFPEKLEVNEILLIARHEKAAGEHSIMNFFAADLGYEIEPLSPVEVKRKAKKNRTTALLAELARLMEDES